MLRLTILLLILMSCSEANYTADEIVEHSIKFHGGEYFNNATISFKFRDKKYVMRNSYDAIDYRRIFQEGHNNIMDRKTHTRFDRYINGKVVDIPDSMKFKYANSVNSVIYFASLPFRLKDDAASLKRLDDVEIDGKSYYKIFVTFNKENGGKDFEDKFCYWFSKKEFALEFMAYEFYTDGGGARFRVRTKTHDVHGLKLLDYDNYKPIDGNKDIQNFDKLVGTEKLVKISEINLQDIEYMGSIDKDDEEN